MKSPTLNQHAILMLIYAMSPSGRIKKGEFLAQVEKELNSLAPDMAFVNGDAIVAVAGSVNGIMKTYPVSGLYDGRRWDGIEIHPIKHIGNNVVVRSDSSPTPLDPDYYSVYLTYNKHLLPDVVIADVATLDQAEILRSTLKLISFTKPLIP